MPNYKVGDTLMVLVDWNQERGQRGSHTLKKGAVFKVGLVQNHIIWPAPIFSCCGYYNREVCYVSTVLQAALGVEDAKI